MVKIISHTPRTKGKDQNTPLMLPETLDIVITCQSGLESLVKRDSEKNGLSNISGQDRLVRGTGSLETVYNLLIQSRFANRIYLSLAHKKVTDWDTLHETCRQIPWEIYITGKERLVIDGSSTRSVLQSIPTLQKIGQQAIFSTLYTPNTANALEVHILLLLIDDQLDILLDITGNPLHKRGYRIEAGEAPIKENLAAALIAFSGWRYREPFMDPCCGSGTLAIEAALMARSIAPGKQRKFRIESLPFHHRGFFEEAHNRAKQKAYPTGEYKIYASDIDPEMVRIAQINAERAGVSGDIIFSVQDASDALDQQPENTTIVTNPPYGLRLKSSHLEDFYADLVCGIKKGGFITTIHQELSSGWKNKKLQNGGETCRFWYHGK